MRKVILIVMWVFISSNILIANDIIGLDYLTPKGKKLTLQTNLNNVYEIIPQDCAIGKAVYCQIIIKDFKDYSFIGWNHKDPSNDIFVQRGCPSTNIKDIFYLAVPFIINSNTGEFKDTYGNNNIYKLLNNCSVDDNSFNDCLEIVRDNSEKYLFVKNIGLVKAEVNGKIIKFSAIRDVNKEIINLDVTVSNCDLSPYDKKTPIELYDGNYLSSLIKERCSHTPTGMCKRDDEIENNSSNDYQRGYKDGYNAGIEYCKNHPSECNLSCENTSNNNYQQIYQEAYNKGYEDGKNSCSGTSQENPFLPPTTSSQCATFDFVSNIFSVPCFETGKSTYSLDFKLINTKPVQLELTNVKKK